MQAEIITIGTELLLGEVVDTNSCFIAEKLSQFGINLYWKGTVGDNWTRICTAIGKALERSDVVIISGGLGPTQDDLTKEVVAAVVGEKLVLKPEALKQIEQRLKARGRAMSLSNSRQAYFPETAEIIPNPIGTAPGVWWEKGSKTIICLPGVPAELKMMMEESVIPRLKQKGNLKQLFTRVMRFRGIGESAVEDTLHEMIQSQTDPTLALYASHGEVHLRIRTMQNTSREAEVLIMPIEEKVRELLGNYIYKLRPEASELIPELLVRRKQTLSTAESCTGGLIAGTFTNKPGSSQYFSGSVVSYSNQVKMKLLSVREEDLQTYGAVSEPVALAMVHGVRALIETDYAIAVTGVAGPGGGSTEKPVGTVYIAVEGPDDRQLVKRFQFIGDRSDIRSRTVREAMELLLELMTQKEDSSIEKSHWEVPKPD
jgi:nicotinamide-nucleotide amidase